MVALFLRWENLLLGTGRINELECHSRDGRELCLTGGPEWGRYTLVKTQM